LTAADAQLSHQFVLLTASVAELLVDSSVIFFEGLKVILEVAVPLFELINSVLEHFTLSFLDFKLLQKFVELHMAGCWLRLGVFWLSFELFLNRRSLSFNEHFDEWHQYFSVLHAQFKHMPQKPLLVHFKSNTVHHLKERN
jgi:hypothetical protein